MAPGSPAWQITLVAVGAGVIAMSLKALSRRDPRLKFAIDFVMFTGVMWIAAMMAYFAVTSFLRARRVV